MATTVGQHQVSTITDPADGSAMVASTMRTATNAVRSGANDHDNDSGIHFQSSVAGSRPAAGTAGRKWLDTDTLLIKYDNGSSWDDMAYFKTTGGTVTGAVTISSGGLTVSAGGLTVSAGGAAVTGNSTVTGSLGVTGAKTTLAATVAGYASLNLPHGTAPSSPADGDLWTTSAGGLYVRVNGATVGPLAATATAVHCHAYNSGTQTINGSTLAELAFDAEVVDTGSMHSNVTNNSRVTVPSTGYYLLVATVKQQSGAAWTEKQTLRFEKNDTSYLGTSVATPLGSTGGGSSVATVSMVVALTAGDFVTCVFDNTAVGAVTCELNEFSVTRVT